MQNLEEENTHDMNNLEMIMDGSHCEICNVFLGKATGNVRRCLLCEQTLDKEKFQRKAIEARAKEKEKA